MSWWNNRNYGYGGNTSYYGGYTKKKTVTEFKQEVQGTTPTLGRVKVGVNFNGDNAGIEGDTIVFPAVDPSKELTTSTTDLFRGFVDTKSSMFRFSDMDYVEAKKDLRKDNEMLHNLFTTIEEMRVAREYCSQYVGAKRNIASLVKQTVNRAIDSGLDGTNHLVAPALATQVLERLGGSYTYMQQQDLLKAGIDMDAMKKYGDEVFDMQSTEEAYQLAIKILDENPPEEEPEEDENNGDGDGDGDNGESQEEQKKDDPEQGDEQEKPTPPKFFYNDETVDDEVNSLFVAPENGDDIPYRAWTTEYDEVIHWSDDKRWNQNINTYNHYMQRIDSTVSTLKRKIELLIQSKRKIDWERHKEFGRFDSRKLVNAYNGKQDVYKVRDDRSDLDTCVQLVVDLSGSMGGGKDLIAMQTCSLLAECFSKIGVPLEIVGFDAREDFDRSEINKTFYSKTQYSRYNNLMLYEFKRFNDRWFDCKKFMPNMVSNFTKQSFGFYQNVDGESVELASLRLRKRPEKRKIMIVLSDGMPAADTDSCYSLNKHLRDTVAMMEKRHDVIGIGICSTAVRKFYKNNIVIDNASELPETGLKLLEQIFLQNGNEEEMMGLKDDPMYGKLPSDYDEYF